MSEQSASEAFFDAMVVDAKKRMTKVHERRGDKSRRPMSEMSLNNLKEVRESLDHPYVLMNMANYPENYMVYLLDYIDEVIRLRELQPPE